jgi:hypothetical protein
MSKWRGMLVWGGSALVFAGLGIFAGGAPTASGGNAQTEMIVAPTSQNVPLEGGDFTVNIDVRNVNNLGAFDFTIRFDNDLLEYIGMNATGWLNSTGRTGVCINPSVGPNGESREEAANIYGALHYGCNTNGLIEEGVGTPGPGGNGTLAMLTFRPKAAGTADIAFEGLSQGSAFVIWESGESSEAGATGLAQVDVCDADGICSEGGIDIEAQSGVVRVYGPDEPEPTGVPATPTKVPTMPAGDFQKTVQAAIGTPRTISTPGAGSSGGTPTGTIGESGSGGVGGTGGRGSTGGAGVQGSGSSAGGSFGPDGAPLAGHGPQGSSDPWAARTGIAIAVVGALALAAGAALQRRAA